MELIFNEISLQPAVSNIHIVDEKVRIFLKTYAAAKMHGFRKVRFYKPAEEIELLSNYTFLDWLNNSKNRTHKDLLLSAKIHPFIKIDDEYSENEYLNRRYFFENEFIERTEPQGLASAILYETLSISLATHDYWKNQQLPVFITDENIEGTLICKTVFNVCEEDNLKSSAILDFIASITTPVLLLTEIKPADKKIHLRDDHGKDKIEVFGKRLFQSEYVVSIINSLPFNPKATNLIRKTYSDGKIEIVLYWEDKGYGFIVQTTGRNIHETNAIAQILIEKFDD